MATRLSVILWEGESLLDGKPIVVLATNLNCKSKNVKTGNMVQTWIMRADIDPITAAKEGEDFSACGNCPHRKVNNQSCFVNLGHGPINAWKKYNRGNCEKFDAAKHMKYFDGRTVRFGSYGDPTAAPFWIWAMLSAVAKKWTGYTHQWENESTDTRFKDLVMASADSLEQKHSAHNAGWRTFRVLPLGEMSKENGEINCPASIEAGKLTTCDDCSLCNGNKNGLHSKIVSITISAHGSTKKRFIEAA